MRVLVRGRSEVLTITRARGVTLSSAKAYDPTTGDDSGITIEVANGAIAAAILSASPRGSDTLYAAGLTVGTPYRLVASDGRELDIIPEGVAGTTVTLRQALPYPVTGGTVYSVTSTATFTIPTTFTGRLLEVEFAFSDGLQQQQSVLLASRLLVTPITSADILARYPRLRKRTQGELGFESQIADVLDRARDEFYRIGIVLDDIRSPGMLKNYLIAEVALLLAQAGFDLMGAGDPAESVRLLMDGCARERLMLESSPNLWIDTDENRTQDDGETGRVGGIRLDWRRRE